MLLQGARLVLVKAVLTAIPIYPFMTLAPPSWVLKEIDKRRRRFCGKEPTQRPAAIVWWLGQWSVAQRAMGAWAC